MSTLAIVATIAAFVIVTAKGEKELPVDKYNCGGKPDGNYEHPNYCTKFISCSGGFGSERECAACHVHPVSCPEGQTVYDLKADACLWDDETSCGRAKSKDAPTA